MEMEKPLLIWRSKIVRLLPVSLRTAAMLATATAAMVMGLNKQDKSIAVAIIGTTPVFQTLTAKFQDTPAFVYFVIANAISSGYNLLVLSLGSLLKSKRAYDILILLFDMLVMALVMTAAAAASSMAELGKNGNTHARWSPICDKFDAFCFRAAGALIASFVGASLLMILNGIVAIGMYKKAATAASQCIPS